MKKSKALQPSTVRQRFSIRKFSVGLASVVIGSFLVTSLPTTVVNAQVAAGQGASSPTPTSVTTHYHYLALEELTWDQRQAIKVGTPQQVAAADQVYYFVYKPSQEGQVLPLTGEASSLLGLAAASVLLVVAVGLVRDRRRTLTSLIVLTSLGQVMMTPAIMALESTVLSQFDQTLTTRPQELLPDPRISIQGYEYVGYLTEEALSTPSNQNGRTTPAQASESLASSQDSSGVTRQDDGSTQTRQSQTDLSSEAGSSVLVASSSESAYVASSDTTSQASLASQGEESEGLISTSSEPASAMSEAEANASTVESNSSPSPVDQASSEATSSQSTSDVTPPTVSSQESLPPVSGELPVESSSDSTSGAPLVESQTESQAEIQPQPEPPSNPAPQPEPQPLPLDYQELDQVLARLQAQVSQLEGNPLDDKTPTSVQAFQAQLAQGKQAQADLLSQSQALRAGQASSQAQIDQVKAQAQALLDQLEVLPSLLVNQADKSSLQSALLQLANQVQHISGLNLSDKTPSSQEPLQVALKAAQAVLQNGRSVLEDLEVNQGEVSAMTQQVAAHGQALDTALARLQDKADTQALRAAISTWQQPLDTLTKTPKSIAAYEAVLANQQAEIEAVLAAAQSLLDNPDASQDQVAEAESQVQALIAKREQAQSLLEEQADKTALQLAKDRLDQATQKEPVTERKRPKTVATYQQSKVAALALSQEASQLLADLNASPTQVLATTERLNQAFEQLEVAEAGILDLVDKEDLIRALAQLQAPVDLTHKTPASLTAYQAQLAQKATQRQASLEEARALIANLDATPEEVAVGLARLAQERLDQEAAQALLVNQAQREALQAQVQAAKARQASAYTAESWEALQAVLAAAEGQLADLDASQTSVDEATQALQQALAQLEPVPPHYAHVEVVSPPSDLDRSVTLRYQLEDPNQLYTGGRVEVYSGDQLIKTVAIEQLSAVIEGLDYHVPYRFHTILTYRRPQGEEVAEAQLEDPEVELDLKKIELKHIKSVQLYHGKGAQAQQVTSLADLPKDLSDYYVKVQSDRFKDVYLAVDHLEEIQHEGQSYYRVTSMAPELVQADAGSSDYRQGYQFLVTKEQPAQGNVYYSFKSLVEAIRQNPAGDYVLGANLNADELALAADATAYVLETFTGSLTGQDAEGVQHAIFNLAAPLFNQLQGARIQHLDLKQVDIKGNNMVASLAKRADQSTIQDVAASGRVSGVSNVAGLVHAVTNNSRLENIRFQGVIQQTGLANNGQDVGGLIGLVDNSSVTNALVDVEMKTQLNTQSARAGGAFGRVVGNRVKSRVQNLLVQGTLVNTGAAVTGRRGAQIGGVVGSTWLNGRLENVISDLVVTNAYRVYGDNGAISGARIRNDLPRWKMTERVVGEVEPQFNPSLASQAEVDQLRQQLTNAGGRLTDTPERSYVSLVNQAPTAYQHLAHYQAGRDQAYANMEKLLPFYNKEQIVKYGNRVALDSKLATQELLSVTPMLDQAFVADYEQDINRLMLHFADQTVEYMGLSDKEAFKQTGIVEYRLGDGDLRYTPNQLIQPVDDIMNALLDIMKGTGLDSPEIWRATGVTANYQTISEADTTARRKQLETKLGRTATEEEVAADLDLLRQERRATDIRRLFFESTFAAFQDTLANDLVKILRQEANFLGQNEAARAQLIEKLRDNRGALLLGLAYMQDHYRVNFDDLNLGEIATYQTDFFGRSTSVVDRLIRLGNLGLNALRSNNSAKTYASTLSSESQKATIVDYLDYFRQLWTDKDQNDWFKDATKANVTIEERPSLEEGLADSPYKIYDRLKVNDYRDYILPLLNLKQSRLFLVSNVLSLTLGSIDRRPNLSLEDFNQQVKGLADRQQAHIDTWYRVALPSVKQRMARANAMLIWDGYANGKNGGWYNGFGDDISNKPVKYPSMAIREFFGRIGRFYGSNGAGAYADTVNGVYFVATNILETDLGTSHYTHEVVHNMDRSVYLGGHGWRPDEVWEEYPQGLLQSAEGPGYDHIGFNTASEWGNRPNRLYNASPSRFQTSEDWGEYTHRLFDILYLLDYTEAKAVMDKGTDAMKQWYNRFINVPDGPNHVNNKVVAITDEEWNQLNIQSIDDFITHSLAPKRYFRDGFTTDRNTYERIPMFHPMYGTGQNDKGSPGGWWFKRMAWELMAYKGYEHGFVPYASNQLERQAKADGTVLNDNYIIQKISEGEFQDLDSFKKAMFKERLDKLANGATFRPITVNNRQVTRLEDLQDLMNEAVDKVLSKRQVTTGKNDVYNLKAEIYRQFFMASDDFRQSIFANE